MKLAIVGAAAALALLAGCSSWSSSGGGSGPAMSSEPVDRGNNTAGVVSSPASQPAGGAGPMSGGSTGTNGTPTNASQPQ